MILSIALGIVLAVIILRALPVMLGLAAIAAAIAFRITLALPKLSVQIVRAIVRYIIAELRAVRLSRSVKLGLCLSVVIVLLFALIP